MEYPEFDRAEFSLHRLNFTYVLRFEPSIEEDEDIGSRYRQFLHEFFNYSLRIVEKVCGKETEFEFDKDITIQIWLMKLPGKQIGNMVMEGNPTVLTLNYRLYRDWKIDGVEKTYLHSSIFHKTSLEDYVTHEFRHKFDRQYKEKAMAQLLKEVNEEEQNRGMPYVLKYIFYNIRREALPSLMDFPYYIRFNLDSIHNFHKKMKKLARHEVHNVRVMQKGKTVKEKVKMDLFYNAVFGEEKDNRYINEFYAKFDEDWYSSRSITHDVAVYCAFIISFSLCRVDFNLVDAIKNGMKIRSPDETVRRQAYMMIKAADTLQFIRLFENAAKKLGLSEDLIPVSIVKYNKLLEECIHLNRKIISRLRRQGNLLVREHSLSLKEFTELLK